MHYRSEIGARSRQLRLRNSFNGLGCGMPSYMDLERIFILRVIKNIDI